MSNPRISYIRNKASGLVSLFVNPRIVVSGDDNQGYYIYIYSSRLKSSLKTYISFVSKYFPGAEPFIDYVSESEQLEFWFNVPFNIYKYVK